MRFQRNTLPVPAIARGCDAAALDIRPIKIALKTEHHISLLDLGSEVPPNIPPLILKLVRSNLFETSVSGSCEPQP